MNSEEFERSGYVVVPSFWSEAELNELSDDINEAGRLIAGPDFSVETADSINPDQQSLIYDRLHYLPALSRASGSSRVRDLCRSLGMTTPWLMGCCNMRMDRPNKTEHLFDWHQDTLYILGSENAVTLWFPLGDVDLHHGTIQVIPGSHKNGIYPFKKISDKPILPHIPLLQRDLCIDYDVTEEPETIVAKRGDVVVFKQMLLHRSTSNNSTDVRWTAQLRITDLGERAHAEQRFPTGDKTNIYYVNYPGFRPSDARAAE